MAIRTKQAEVILLGGGNARAWTVELLPGARVIDLKRALGLNGAYNFSLKGRGFLNDSADLYRLVAPEERDKVFAAPSAELG